MNKQTKRAVDKLQRQVASNVVMGKILAANENSAKVAFSPDEVHEAVPMVQHFGFASRPPANSPCLAVNNGNRATMAIINSAGKCPTSLKEGDACLYSKKSFIHLAGDKLRVSNGTSDLLELLAKLCNALVTATVPTESGPKPLSTLGEISTIKGELDAFIHR